MLLLGGGGACANAPVTYSKLALAPLDAGPLDAGPLGIGPPVDPRQPHPENWPSVHHQRADSGPCRCWEQKGGLKTIFYNRIPKCGSSTMLRYIEAASKSRGVLSKAASRKKLQNAGCFMGPTQLCRTPQRAAFDVIHSHDFNASHFHPYKSTSRAIATNMTAQARGHSVLFERHIHYIDFHSMGFPDPTYINLMRDPAALLTSSFYFFRDCICNQQSSYGPHAVGDEWCQADWYRKSPAVCSLDINECFDDYGKCQHLMPELALGGTVGIDFICGTHSDCDGALNVKLERAKANLRDNYLWVGILERLPESLSLLQKLLPDQFGAMDAQKWSDRVYQPDGQESGERAGSADAPEPTEATLSQMKADPRTAAEYNLYDFAEQLLGCKLRACSLDTGVQLAHQTGGSASAGLDSPSEFAAAVGATGQPPIQNETLSFVQDGHIIMDRRR